MPTTRGAEYLAPVFAVKTGCGALWRLSRCGVVSRLQPAERLQRATAALSQTGPGPAVCA